MRDARLLLVLFAMVAGFSLMTPDRAEAQAVGFAPTVGVVPDGVSLNVTPVVTADRRYVRLSLNPNFSTINGFSNFPVPAAVGGGGSGGGVRGGLGGLGVGGGGGGAGGGGVGGGFRNVMGGAGLVGSGVPYNVEFLEASRKADAQARLRKAKSAVGKKPLPDAFIVPIKKAKADAPRG